MKEKIIALVSDKRFQGAVATIVLLIVMGLVGVNVPLVP